MSDATNLNQAVEPMDPNDPNSVWGKEQAPFAGAAPVGAGPAAGGDAYAAGAPPAGSWGPAGGGYAAPPPPPVGSPGEPNPVLAAFLGLIPGVGAMYNGQFAKGIVHVVVFAVLVFFANNVSDVFGIFVSGWIGFMAYEAYHTAKARRDGLPLPNAFGWNDIGEHMGLGKNWPFSPGATATAGGTTAGARPAPGAAAAGGWAAASASYAGPTGPVPPVPPMGAAGYGVAPNWAGYVPPSAFASAAPTGSGAGGGGAAPQGQGVPYAPVSAGAPYPPMPPVDMAATQSRLPVGAIWLIALGVLFLLGQWTPLLQVGRVWIPSVLLVGIAGLLFARRMGWTGSSAWQRTNGLPVGLRAACSV